jgi:ParB-like chromosome segregation protein Spo0J
MVKCIRKVKEIDVATVEGNKTMAESMDRRAIQRCKDAIEQLGVVHTPVVGATKSGKRQLLPGQCELTVLRELGVNKMDAIEIDLTGDGDIKAKLSLLLMSLNDKPGALCEALLLQEAVNAGVSRLEIQDMLGKSASWVSNRLSLVMRLDINVYELVKNGLLEPRSAQDIARLPANVQFTFAETAVREGLPKSAVEQLVGAYNDEGCPYVVKEQIVSDPRAALKRVTDRRRAVNADKPDRTGSNLPIDAVNEIVKSARFQAFALRRLLSGTPSHEVESCRDALKELEFSLSEMLAMIRGIFSPGKMEVWHEAG